MRRDLLLDSAARIRPVTACVGIPQFVEEVRPTLHHHTALRQIECLVGASARFDGHDLKGSVHT
jgi:hypothetical protein